MGSLNGDIMVMRNGRSTSQISVYNYPEHLNPFYEDDQHKRLRFWKISKNDNVGRRNSFSFGNLRDMWTFKSMRSKKKSSTLGITKTSESPPPLRRDVGATNNGWNTFDNRLRHSTATSMNSDNFQRNATYRSSLQTLPTNTDRIGFNRNDDYRSTIQIPCQNPLYRPQPQTPQAAGLRSSMTSTGSTNPFDSDDEGDLADASTMRSINGGSTSTLSKATPRKKRRAPAPPTPIHGRTPTIRVDSSQENAQSIDLCIREDSDIAHLTAEIETFVKDKSNEDIETLIKKENQTKIEVSVSKDKEPSTAVILNEVPPASSSLDDEGTQITQKVEKSPPPPKEIRKTIATTKTQSLTSTTPDTDKAVTILSSQAATNVETETVNKEITTIGAIPKVRSPIPPKRNFHNVNTETSKNRTVYNSNTTGHVPPETELSTEPELPAKLHSPKKIGISSNNGPTKATETKSKVNISEAKENEDRNVTKTTKTPMLNDNQDVIYSQETIKTSTGNTQTEIPHTNGSVVSEIGSPEKTILITIDKSHPITPILENSLKTETSLELKSNGAIPKKLNSFTQAGDSGLCIKETNSQEPQRPVPMKRVSKTDTEQGQMECIHVHVGSPRATPREEHANRLSSFKSDSSHENAEVITTKTPFILTSPPAQLKYVQETKQTAEVGNAYVVPLINAFKVLNIQENTKSIKSEVKPKPPLSPKPVVEKNSQIQNFAEIHKPIRSKVNQTTNGHVRRISQEDISLSPPTAPKQQLKEEERAQQLIAKETVNVFESNLVIKETPATASTNSHSNVQTSASSCDPVATTVSLRTETEVETLIRPKPQSHLEWKQSTLAPLEEHIPPEKRKSVKDIIESINRSQRLLHAAANKDFTIITTNTSEPLEEPASHQENLQILEENQREIKRIIREIDEVSAAPPSYSECVGAQKLDNNEIFKKCKLDKEVYDYRETSPITSNLDWNPVPKPKRTKTPNEN